MIVPAAVVAVVDADWRLKQQFYDDVRAKQYAAAVTDGQAYVLRHPTDERFELDLAYAQVNAGDRTAAVTRLHALVNSSDSTVATAARNQLAAMGPITESPRAPAGYLYAYSQDESRFKDVFNGVVFRYDFSNAAVRPFASVNLTYDTRSGVPGVAAVYNDNAAIPSVGLRAPLDQNDFGYVYVSAGESLGLRGQPSFPEARYGIAYSRDYGMTIGSGAHTLVYFSAAEYSRYAGNAIAYTEVSHDVPVTRFLRAVAGINLAADSHRAYYNNYADAYAGLLIPVTSAVSVRAVGVAGDYLPRGIGVPKPFYSGVRVLLVTGTNVP